MKHLHWMGVVLVLAAPLAAPVVLAGPVVERAPERPNRPAPKPTEEMVRDRAPRAEAEQRVRAEKERVREDLRGWKENLSNARIIEDDAQIQHDVLARHLNAAVDVYLGKEVHTPAEEATYRKAEADYMFARDNLAAAKEATSTAIRNVDALRARRDGVADPSVYPKQRQGRPVRQAGARVLKNSKYGKAAQELYTDAPPELSQYSMPLAGFAAVGSMEKVYDKAPAPQRIVSGALSSSGESRREAAGTGGYSFAPSGPIRQNANEAPAPGGSAAAQMEF